MTTKTKHTPGPWIHLKKGYEYEILCNKRNDVLADVYDHFKNKNESELEANARLIAAAPELLEACKRALQQLDESLPTDEGNKMAVKRCKDAISKAEGTL